MAARPDAPPPTGPVRELVAEVVASVSADMERNLDSSSTEIRALLEEHLPQMRGDRRWADLLRASIAVNVETVLHVLQHGAPSDGIAAPAAAVAYARRMAQNAIPLEVLVRSYRISLATLQDGFLERLAAGVAAAPPAHGGGDAAVVLAAARHMVSVSHSYVDSVVVQLVDVYEHERDRWSMGRESRRAERVRAILEQRDEFSATRGDEAAAPSRHGRRVVAGKDVDGELGYDLAQLHLAAVLWLPDGNGSAVGRPELQREARGLGALVGPAAAPLAVEADEASLWAWFPLDPAAGASLRLSEVRARWDARSGAASQGGAGGAVPSASVALGIPAAGRRGFRRSHEHAVLARSVAVQSDRPPGAATSYDEPGLSAAAMLSADPSAASAWVRETLGGLAGHADAPTRLRETVRTFYLHGGSHKAAAEVLHLHPNTVKYRMRRAEEMRGRPLHENRADVELAVSLCHWMGRRVLAG